MQTITSLADAQFLNQMDTICLDIETQTTAPHNGWGSKFGLSACAPITWLSMHAEGYPTVVFDLRPNGTNNAAQISAIRGFVASVLARPRITIIGHNVSFDLRALGNQFGFRIHLDSNVWDTLTMAILLLMAEAEDGETALISLIKKYGLLTDDDQTFSEHMKSQRGVLDGEVGDDVLRYVALDTIAAQRLYRLQRHVIDTSQNPTATPVYLRNEDLWTIVDRNPSDFLATKNWSKLPELVMWEQRISRWSCNAAIDGVRLDKEYVHKHLEQLSQEFGEAVQDVLGRADPTDYTGFDLQFCTLAYYKEILEKLHEYRISHNSTIYKGEKWYTPKIDTSKWINWAGAQGSVPRTEIPIFDRQQELYKDEQEHWLDYLENFPNVPPPDSGVPTISLTRFVFDNCFKGIEDGWMRANYKAKWLYEWYLLRKPLEPSTIVNKSAFKDYYVFCVEMCKFPDTTDIARLSDLVTGTIKKTVEDDDGELDYKKLAMDNNAWSLGKDALAFYFPKANEDDHDEEEHVFRLVADHAAKMTRIEEFLRHAESDGRIHSTIARKTRTGRATSTNMNLQNIDTKFFRGYLVANTDERLLGGVDVSNAENWFAALTFADNALALACAGGDFHAANTRAYWPDTVAALDKRIAAGDALASDEFSALRKTSKFITFGGAYGAGRKKIARMVGCSREDAAEILANRDKSYPNYAAGKRTMAERAETCYRQGIRPPFTTLWTGRRISVPLRTTEKGVEVSGYKCANYLQQGGVGELIWRAVVQASEFFEREGWDVKIPLQVHDEIIFDAPLDIFFQVAQKIIQIIAEVVPEPILNRTVPACRFLSDIGAGNAKKWGWRYNTVYPLDKNVFVNRWGIHTLAEGGKEATTWIGDLANGYTLEGELLAANSPRLETSDDKQGETQKVELTPNRQWQEFSGIVTRLNKIFPTLSILVTTPAELKINGEYKGTFGFAERMIIHQDMHHKGHDPDNEYWDTWGDVEYLRDVAKEILDWSEKYAN